MKPNLYLAKSAMAGALGVCLTQRGHYVLNAAGAPPATEDIARCRHITLAAASIAAVPGRRGATGLRRRSVGARMLRRKQ